MCRPLIVTHPLTSLQPCHSIFHVVFLVDKNTAAMRGLAALSSRTNISTLGISQQVEKPRRHPLPRDIRERFSWHSQGLTPIPRFPESGKLPGVPGIVLVIEDASERVWSRVSIDNQDQHLLLWFFRDVSGW